MQEDRLLQIFLDLIRIDSPSGHEEKVREYIVKFVQKLGLNHIQDARGNLIVKVDGVGKSVLLGAHLDTVEPGRGINPQIKDSILKSDGKTILGADNKVAVAAILEVLESSIENRIKTTPLDVVFTVAEETDFGSVKLDYRKIEAKKGYLFDSAVPIGSIIIASPFCTDFHIKIVGKAAHASMPEDAINALKVLAIAISKIKLGKINDKTIANIGIVNSGHATNTIPGEAIAKGEVRSFEKKEVEDYSNLIVKEFNKTASRFGADIEVKISEACPGYEYSEDDESIQEAKEIIEELNLTPIFMKKWVCSDANILNQHGIKILNLGDGVNNPHTVNEFVSIKDLDLLAKLISSLITPLHTAHI